MKYKKYIFNLLVINLLITSQVCLGYQSQNFGTIAKTDSINYYIDQNKPLKAINYARTKSTYYLEHKNYSAFCDMMIEKSKLYKKFNDNENALKVLYEARNIAEKSKLSEKEILIYIEIGFINSVVFEYTKAKKHFQKAEKIALKLNNRELLAKVNQGYFKIHGETQSDSAEYYLKKVAHYSKGSKDFIENFRNYSNFFQFYFEKNEYATAKKYLDSANTVALKIKDEVLIMNCKNSLGVLYLTVDKDYPKAKDLYLSIINSNSSKNNISTLGDAYLNASYAYEKMGDFKNALNYNNKYLEIFDEVSTGRFDKANQEIETRYAINKIETEYKEKEKLIKERQERNQKLLLLFASLFILAGFIFYFYYQNLMLKQKNKLKDIDAKLQYKIISATLDGQDQERNKISGILHDHVSALLSSVGLHLSAFESNLDQTQIADLKKTRTLLKDAHDKVRDLSHELVPPLLVKLGLQFALKDLCENNSNSIIKFEFFSALPKDRRFNSDFETKMFFIVSELLNNVMKHSNASKAKLSLEELGNQLHITIEDNGKGFDTKNISKSNGFGITQIRARVKNMNGDMKINSKLNQGTTIIIKVDI
ncbi:sensor histidine kinase [Flavobacterium sp.]|uniref:tetratricopeptide repeat-containing sensor histidine kinase n=1 Tax=Flavobacterium sp. TaxID=239 RepID=UPI00261D3AF1|nr:sensor histidine kinase [Flavobacterium sp.]